MALGALIGAYQEDDAGGLTALLPLAGRTLVEYQVRCAAAAGASPIVVLVERIPAALNQAFARLTSEGLNVVLVSDGSEAATRFEPGELVLLIGDGVAPPLDLLTGIEAGEPLVLTVPDDDAHQDYERVDGASRWSGVAIVEGHMLGATAAMLGDWDLPSTLLRRSIQGGARLVPVAPAHQRPGKLVTRLVVVRVCGEAALVIGRIRARRPSATPRARRASSRWRRAPAAPPGTSGSRRGPRRSPSPTWNDT